MVSTVTLLAAANPGVDFIYRHSKDGREFVFDTREIKGALGRDAFCDPGLRSQIRRALGEGLREIGAEVPDVEGAWAS
jgi:hypothetical protein